MNATELAEVIKKGEDSTQQFKEQIESIDSLAAEICAFANSEGGTILVGVSNQGAIKGLTAQNVDELNQKISNVCSQKIDPPVYVLTENVLVNDDNIVVILTIPVGNNKYYIANGRDIWVKIGADKRRASREEVPRLLQESGNIFADEISIENTSINDLDLLLFRDFYEKRFSEPLDNTDILLEKLLTNMKLLQDRKCTLAGLMLFGKRPEEKKPSFIVKAISFYGNDQSGENYRDSRDISGNIPQLFTSTISFLKNQLRMLQMNQGFNSTGLLEIPQVAIEEAVVNALMHRNYFIMSNIRIFVFDNRVEIISPGSLPNTLSVDSIKQGIHIERNPIMVSLIRDITGIPYRGAGTGILRIMRLCNETGIKVEFHNDKTSEQFKVIFYRNEGV